VNQFILVSQFILFFNLLKRIRFSITTWDREAFSTHLKKSRCYWKSCTFRNVFYC